MENMVLVVLLLQIFVLVVLAQEKATDDRAKLPTCKNPKGNIGETVLTGCEKLVCLRKKKKAYWAESFARSLCCSFQYVGYKITHNITTFLARDNCTKMTLYCGGKKGDPQIDILTDNHECPNGSWKESLDDLSTVATEGFSLIKAFLEEIVNSTERIEGECNLSDTSTTSTTLPLSTSEKTTVTAEESTCPPCPTLNSENCSYPTTSPTLPPYVQGSEMLLIGPGHSVNPEILSLPSFSSTNCTVPTKNIPKSDNGYVATVMADGVMICGGRAGDGIRTNECRLLTNAGFWLSSPPIASMMTTRNYAAAVRFDGGWWVIGGYNGSSAVATTETFFEQNKTWVPSVEYPEPVNSHCVVKINETHIFSAGGHSTYILHSTYIYSKAEGFVQQESMKKGRHYHACSLFEDKIYVVAGVGAENHVEYFSLASQTWEDSVSVAPALPVSTYRGQLMVLDGSLTFISGYNNKKIFKFVKIIWSSYTHYEWEEVGELKNWRMGFQVLRWNVTDCTKWNV